MHKNGKIHNKIAENVKGIPNNSSQLLHLLWIVYSPKMADG